MSGIGCGVSHERARTYGIQVAEITHAYEIAVLTDHENERRRQTKTQEGRAGIHWSKMKNADVYR